RRQPSSRCCPCGRARWRSRRRFESFKDSLCPSQRSFRTREKNVFHPVSVWRQNLAVSHLVNKPGPENVPMGVLTTLQIFLRPDNGLLKVLDPFKDGLSLWVKTHDQLRIAVSISSTTFFASPKSIKVFSL